MKTTMTYATVAAQPGWFLAVFTNSGGIDRYEPVIAWEIQRTTSSKGLVTRFPIPITAESKNKDLDCAIWGIKRPDGKFVFPVGENEQVSEEKLSRFALSMETEEPVKKVAFGKRPNVHETSAADCAADVPQNPINMETVNRQLDAMDCCHGIRHY